MRVFVSDLNGIVGKAVRQVLAEGEHEIVGTVQAGEQAPGKVAEVAEVGSPEAEDLAFSADGVVVTLAQDLADAKTVVRALRRDIGEDQQKVVIGISTVLTWARCAKPAEDEKLNENNYKGRKPSPKYAEYRSVESYIMNLAREGVNSTVLAAGILYGGGEDLLHSLFKEAWECECAALAIPSAAGGNNVLPMVHVVDVARAVAAMLEAPVEKKYVVAVDSANSTLAEVVTAISASLGPGAVRTMEAAEADEALILRPGLPELQVDMAFDVDDSAVGGLGIEWHAQGGFVENCATVVEEYIRARNLRPLRIALLGPPASGKTALGAALAQAYYVPHVTAATALATVREQESELAAEVNAAIEAAGDGRLTARLFCKAVRSVLESPKLRNRGYVLDGLPRTFDEAKYLFAEVGEDEEDAKAGDEDEAITVVPASMPTGIISLAGDTEVFAARVRALPEDAVEGTHNTEDGFARRSKAYADANTPEDPRATVVFFEKYGGVDTLTMEVTEGSTIDGLVEAAVPYVETGGKPYNYHPSPEEIAAERAAAENKRAAAAAAAAKAEADRLEEERRAKAAREEEERQRLAEIAKQEAQLLEARSAPLRGYLVENVLPTLTQGLLEVCKANPSDPIDYLAEYLFRNSPASDGSEYEAKLKADAK